MVNFHSRENGSECVIKVMLRVCAFHGCTVHFLSCLSQQFFTYSTQTHKKKTRTLRGHQSVLESLMFVSSNVVFIFNKGDMSTWIQPDVYCVYTHRHTHHQDVKVKFIRVSASAWTFQNETTVHERTIFHFLQCFHLSFAQFLNILENKGATIGAKQKLSVSVASYIVKSYTDLKKNKKLCKHRENIQNRKVSYGVKELQNKTDEINQQIQTNTEY